MWWVYRNSLKPLSASVAEINNARLLYYTSFGFDGKAKIKAKDCLVKWFKDPNSDNWDEEKLMVEQFQRELDEKNGIQKQSN